MDHNNNSKTILIIEDEPSLRLALLAKLQSENFNMIEAGDGQEGLKISLEKHPDLIILDLMLPVLDGVSFLNELHKDEWGKNAKIIILSNVARNDLPDRATMINDYPYFEKTKLDLDNFLESVKLTLN